VICKERQEETREKEDMGHLAKIHLNFENSKYDQGGSSGLLRCVLQMVGTILQVFRIFKQVEKRF
jgi:hypothetical protein